jgi:hypothetical protein
MESIALVGFGALVIVLGIVKAVRER